MKVKVSEATNIQLDWMVAKCWYTDRRVELTEGKTGVLVLRDPEYDGSAFSPWFIFFPTTYWDQGGPIIERERMTLSSNAPGYWNAWHRGGDEHGEFREHWARGPTPLIAAMRCFCCSKLGDEVEVPEDLK